MKKWIVLSLVCIILLATAGCATVTVSCGIDEQSAAYIAYDVVADVSTLGKTEKDGISSSLNELAVHLESKGFTVEKTGFFDAGDSVELACVIRRDADSYMEAFDALEQLLTDENITPFVYVNMASAEEAYDQAFVLEVQTDVAAMMQAGGLDRLPPYFRENVDRALSESTADIVLTLPATEIAEGDGAFVEGSNIYIQSTALDLHGITTAKLATRVSVEDGQATDIPTEETVKGLEGQLAQTKTHMYIVAAVLIASAAVAVVSGITIAKKKRVAAKREKRDFPEDKGL